MQTTPAATLSRSIERVRRALDQNDADRTIGRLHQASTARAYADGVLVRIETTRFEDGRSLQSRHLLPTARRLRDELDAAIRAAEAEQDRRDAAYAESPWAREVAE